MIPQLIKGNFNLQILKFNLGYIPNQWGILGSLKNHYPLDGLYLPSYNRPQDDSKLLEQPKSVEI
jgi:hypothetical protein